MENLLPANDVILKTSLSYFEKTSHIFLTLISLIFFMRVSYLLLKVSPPSDYVDLIKDITLYFASLMIFPMLITLSLDLIAALAQRLSFLPNTEAHSVLQNMIDNLFHEFPFMMVFSKIGHLIITKIAQSIYTLFMTLLIAASPIFLFLTLLLNLGSTMKSYFLLFLSLALWPLMWNLIGSLSQEFLNNLNSAPLTLGCFYFVLQILQLLSPIFTYTLIKNLSLDLGAKKLFSTGASLCP